MIPLIKPADAFSEWGRVKRDSLYSSLCQSTEVGCRGVEAADVIIEEADLHTSLDGLCQDVSQVFSGLVSSDDVKLKINGVLCLLNGRKKFSEEIAPGLEQRQVIAMGKICFGAAPEPAKKTGRFRSGKLVH
jgi:hypothetical protein